MAAARTAPLTAPHTAPRGKMAIASEEQAKSVEKQWVFERVQQIMDRARKSEGFLQTMLECWAAESDKINMRQEIDAPPPPNPHCWSTLSNAMHDIVASAGVLHTDVDLCVCGATTRRAAEAECFACGRVKEWNTVQQADVPVGIVAGLSETVCERCKAPLVEGVKQMEATSKGCLRCFCVTAFAYYEHNSAKLAADFFQKSSETNQRRTNQERTLWDAENCREYWAVASTDEESPSRSCGCEAPKTKFDCARTDLEAMRFGEGNRTPLCTETVQSIWEESLKRAQTSRRFVRVVRCTRVRICAHEHLHRCVCVHTRTRTHKHTCAGMPKME